MKKAAIGLDVGDLYKYLAAMISRKPFDGIMNSEDDYKKRLGFTGTAEEKAQLQMLAKKNSKEIYQVLHRVNKLK